MVNRGAGYYLEVFLLYVKIDYRRKVFMYGLVVLKDQFVPWSRDFCTRTLIFGLILTPAPKPSRMGLTSPVFYLPCRFITRRGFKICANPQADWVKKAVAHVDNRNSMSQTKPTGPQQSTSTPFV